MHERLVDVIRLVRRRWRLRIALHGAAVLAATALVAVALGGWIMDQARFAPPVVVMVRAVAWLALAGLAWWFVARPLWRRAGDAQVALYLEEHAPALSGQIAGAVQFGAADTPGVSRALVERLVADALVQLESRNLARAVEQPRLSRSAVALGIVAAVSGLLAVLQPPFVARGAGFLLPLAGAAASPYRIDVTPGDTILPRGAELEIGARLRGFASEVVTVALRRGQSESWERYDMPPADSAGLRRLFLLGFDSSAAYYVEAGGVRSRVYTIAVRDQPYVRGITVTYHFPAYTGLPPQRQDDGGDIVALEGTRVEVAVTSTVPATAGALVVDGQDPVPLAPADSTLAGSFEVRAEGGYRVHLAGADGRQLPASPAYTITLLEDRPPGVTVTRPGRDITASNIEEIAVEARAEDDYGVRLLELVYAVNGGAERVAPLYRGAARRQATGAHTLFLEELNLAVGDVVALYARARDARPTRPAGSRQGQSDIYFITIRPFDRTYREAEQGAAQEGDAPATPVGQLSRRQREIVAATYNLERDRARYGDAEYRQNLATLALAQGRLREEVATLAGRLVERGVTVDDSGLARIAQLLPQAVREMQAAEEALGRRDPRAALGPEQRALQQLQRAETIFRSETQVARGGEPGAGAGGDGEVNEELRDLFELDLDRMRSQYEQVERGRREQAQRETDAVLERLRELARRQQQENERREAESRRGAASRGGAGGQSRLAAEADSLARHLERLTREQPSAELSEAARRLAEAADAMRRAAADRRGAQGASALERLREARRRLEQSRATGLASEARELEQRARRLAEQQREVQGDVGRLEQDDPQARSERVRRLVDRKQQMADEVGRLGSDAERVARDARADQPEAARRIAEAARGARDARLEDKIRFSRGIVQGGRSPDYARAFEEQIGADIEQLRQRLADAAGAIGETREQRLGRALDRARDLAGALEGLGERARAADSGAGRVPGARGEPGAPPNQRGEQPGSARGEPGEEPGAARGGNRAQLRREMDRRLADLDALRQALRREGVDASELDRLRGTMRRLDSRLASGDTAAVAQLERDVIDGLKEFEFALRRALTRTADRPQLRGSDEVAPEYRRMVEEYYRNLARRRN